MRDEKVINTLIEQQRFFLAAVVDSTKDSVVTIDFNGLITSWNKAAEDLYGYPGEEAIGKNLSLVVLPEDIMQLFKNIDSIKNSQEVKIYDTIRLHKGGELTHLEVMLSPVKNDQDQVIGVSTIARNITDRVKAEEALKQSEARFRALVSQTAVGIYQADLDRVVTFANSTLCILLDCEKEELVGRPLWSNTFVGDLARETILFRSFKQHHTSFEIEKRIVKKSGEVRWVRESVSAIYDPAGEVQSTMGVLLDITEAKNAEQEIRDTSRKFEVVLESLPQMTWTNLPNGEVNFYNQKWYEYTGLTFDQTKGWFWKTVVHPDDISFTLEAYKVALANMAVFEIENRCKGYDGSYRWHLNRALPVKNDKGEVLLWVGTATDIHAQRSSLDELEHMVLDRTSELARSNDDLLHFAHVASHDLKEPLRKIRTFCRRLEDEFMEGLPINGQSYLEKIHNAAERMTTMVDGILAYSRVSADNAAFEIIDLNMLLENVAQDLDLLIQQKSATIHANPLPALRVSPVLFYQLFFNLIINALKFSRPTVSPRIVINSEEVVQSGDDFIVLTISDNGIGFDQKYAEQYLKPLQGCIRRTSMKAQALVLHYVIK